MPVLAVTPVASEQPRRAIAAIDFSPSSLSAARSALNLLRPTGTLFLAHLQPDFSTAASRANGIESSYSPGIRSALERVVRELAPPPCMSIEVVIIVNGTLIDELSALADRVDAGVIAVGTSRRDAPPSNGVAHLATALLRQRQRTILTVPAPIRPIQRVVEGT